MSRSSQARRASITDIDRRQGAVPDPAPRILARLGRLNADWVGMAPGLTRRRPDSRPVRPRRRWSRLWLLVPLLATAGIALALRQAAPWIDREDARLGATMTRALHIDCLDAGNPGAAGSPPACR